MIENQIVSIIVPVYNVQEYIKDCINSIICQTYKELEIILVDDGSSDNSLQICKDMAQKDNRIVVLSQLNSGVVNARKNGVNRATGKYIMFVDSDDYVNSDYVESMMKISNEFELVTSGIFVGNRKVFDCINSGEYDVDRLSPVIKNMIYAQDNISRGILSCVCAKRFETELTKKIFKNLDEDIYYGEDGEFVYKYIINCKKICVTNNCNYNYRMNNLSVTHKKHDDFLINVNRLYISLKKEFEKSTYSADIIPQLEKWIFEHIRTAPENMGFGPENVPIKFVLKCDENFVDKKIVVYGAGKVGKDYIRQIKKEKMCKEFIWVDKNYASKEMYMEEHVCSPEKILAYEFDYILIAINNDVIIKEIKSELQKKFGVSSEKIISCKPLYIKEFYA